MIIGGWGNLRTGQLGTSGAKLESLNISEDTQISTTSCSAYFVFWRLLFSYHKVFTNNVPIFCERNRECGHSQVAPPPFFNMLEPIAEIIFSDFFFLKHNKGGQNRLFSYLGPWISCVQLPCKAILILPHRDLRK